MTAVLAALIDDARGANCDGVFSVQFTPSTQADRISIAPEAMARIAEVLNTGGSIVVSDLGIAQGGETGEGTDFIVPLR